MKVFHK